MLLESQHYKAALSQLILPNMLWTGMSIHILELVRTVDTNIYEIPQSIFQGLGMYIIEYVGENVSTSKL